MYHQSEGVILKCAKFSDYDQIVTIFSQNEGIIKCILKGALRPKSRLNTLNSPLTQLEIIYSKGNSELYKCKDLSLVNSHLFLRHSLIKLKTAILLSDAILFSQLLHQPAPQLYQLFLQYLKKIEACENLEALVTSFYLKVLKHEGILNLNSFSIDEKHILERLSHCKNFSEIYPIPVPKEVELNVQRSFFREFSLH